MRLLQFSVAEERREAAEAAIEEREFGYAVQEGDGAREGHDLVSVIAPADAVEDLLADLRNAGLDRDVFTVSIDADFADFAGRDEVQNRWAKTPNRIAPGTLRSKAKDMRPNTRSYVWMMVLSTVVATAGLLIGSPAIVVGSMVLAPIVGPMLTASIGAVRDDREMLLDSVHQQGLGLGVAVVGAVALGLVIRELAIVPVVIDVSSLRLVTVRLAPGLLSVPVGLAAGAAGAFGLATKGNVSIVGVMVAAALIPTAATAGIAFAWGAPVVGSGALFLLVLTIVAVNVGGYLMFTYLGYRPDDVDEGLFELSTAREAAVVGATTLVVVVVVLVVLVGSVQHLSFQHDVNRVTTDVLDRDSYDGLELNGLSVEYGGYVPFDESPTVSVTLARTGGGSYPELPNELARTISNRTDENVSVRLEFQDVSESNRSSVRRTGNGPSLPGRAVVSDRAAVRRH